MNEAVLEEFESFVHNVEPSLRVLSSPPMASNEVVTRPPKHWAGRGSTGVGPRILTTRSPTSSELVRARVGIAGHLSPSSDLNRAKTGSTRAWLRRSAR